VGKNRTTSLAAIGLAASLAVGLAACSGAEGSSLTDTTLKVCSDMPYEPFEAPGAGPRGLKFTGFDIELLDAMAAKDGNKLDVIDSDFDTIFAAVNAKKCDIVASAVTITAERQKNSLFTAPYFDADQSLLVPADSDVKALDDLAGKTIGVQSGTTGESYAKDHTPDGATIKAYPDAAGLFGAINAGQIAAVLQDLPVNSDRATKDDTVKVVATIPTGEKYGFAVAKENTDLKELLDEELKAVRADGTYDKLYEKYFPNAG
jgi:polar amino acid transport system substrate-binding protein